MCLRPRAVNPFSVRHGYVCWKVRPQGSKEKPELYGKKIVPMGQPKPALESLQAFDSEGNEVDHSKHPWVDVIGLDLACVTGEDIGEQVKYEPSSQGGLQALDKFIDALMKQIDKDAAKPVAIIELQSDFYNNKGTGGKTYFPVFPIIDWVAADATSVPEPVKTTEPETKQTKAETKQAEPEPETAQEEQAANTNEGGGERRRRRRA